VPDSKNIELDARDEPPTADDSMWDAVEADETRSKSKEGKLEKKASKSSLSSVIRTPTKTLLRKVSGKAKTIVSLSDEGVLPTHKNTRSSHSPVRSTARGKMRGGTFRYILY
jgi:CCR4-NOT transcriptional regulation complex NOT5 subunit